MLVSDQRGRPVALRQPRGVTWADALLYGWALAAAAALLARWISPALDHKAIDAVLGVQTFGLIAFAATHPQRQLRRLGRTRLARRQCPACCYDLTGLAAADDGCTACPECGAAWKMPESKPDASA